MKLFRNIWSSSEFDAKNVTRFAQPVMREEARQGIFTLGLLTMLLMVELAARYFALGLGTAYLYTFVVLGMLALHVAFSAKTLPKTADIQVFYIPGVVLLAVGALAFALLAHRYSVFSCSPVRWHRAAVHGGSGRAHARELQRARRRLPQTRRVLPVTLWGDCAAMTDPIAPPSP